MKGCLIEAALFCFIRHIAKTQYYQLAICTQVALLGSYLFRDLKILSIEALLLKASIQLTKSTYSKAILPSSFLDSTSNSLIAFSISALLDFFGGLQKWLLANFKNVVRILMSLFCFDKWR